MSQERVTVQSKVSVNVFSLKWGDALSTFLPGAVAVYAVAPFVSILQEWLDGLNSSSAAGSAAALTVASVLAGGILEAISRLTWERWWLIRVCPSMNVLPYLRDSPSYVELYERGVQSSYKYVTFYANFAWATTALIIGRAVNSSLCSVETLILSVTVLLLLRASHVQWTYFVNYQNQVFGPLAGKETDDAEERSASRDENSLRDDSPQ